MEEKKVVKKTYTGVYGLIIKNNKILLIRKARGGYKGKLDLPGGGLEQYEHIEECLRREIMEETEMTVKECSLIGVSDTNIVWLMDKKENLYEDLHHVGIIYKVEAEGNNKEDADGRDSEGSNYYDLEKLNKEELSPFAKYAVEHIGF